MTSARNAARKSVWLVLALPVALIFAFAAGKARATTVPNVPAGTKPLASLTWNLNFGEPLTMDSGKVVDFDDQFVLSNLCEPLQELTASGNVVAGLATSIDQTSPTSYVAHIRQGVKFWNGQPMTASDVAFSMNRQLNSSLGSYFMPLLDGAFKSATAKGTYTVDLKLKRPSSIFVRLLTTPLSMVVDQSFVKAHGSKYGSPQVGPMCTGPYKFTSWSPGQNLIVTRNPNWWGAAHQKVLLKQAKFVFVGDTNTSTAALTTGEANGEFLVPAASVPRLKNAGGTLINAPSTLFYNLTAMGTKGPGTNLDIRKAVAALIDYTGFSTSQFQGTAITTKTLASPASWGYESGIYSAAYGRIPAPKEDIAAARRLVKASGLKNPVVDIATTAVSLGAPELLDQMAQAGKQAGITIVNKVLSVSQFGTLFSSASARNAYSFMYQEATADIPDPLELYDQVALPTGGENYLGYKNATVTKLLNEANATANAAKKATLTTQAQTIITQQLPWIPIVSPYLTTYVTSNVGGLKASFPSVMYAPWLTSIGGR